MDKDHLNTLKILSVEFDSLIPNSTSLIEGTPVTRRDRGIFNELDKTINSIYHIITNVIKARIYIQNDLERLRDKADKVTELDIEEIQNVRKRVTQLLQRLYPALKDLYSYGELAKKEEQVLDSLLIQSENLNQELGINTLTNSSITPRMTLRYIVDQLKRTLIVLY